MTFHRVLVATDFSSGSESALRVATRLAKLSDTELQHLGLPVHRATRSPRAPHPINGSTAPDRARYPSRRLGPQPTCQPQTARVRRAETPTCLTYTMRQTARVGMKKRVSLARSLRSRR